MYCHDYRVNKQRKEITTSKDDIQIWSDGVEFAVVPENHTVKYTRPQSYVYTKYSNTDIKVQIFDIRRIFIVEYRHHWA